MSKAKKKQPSQSLEAQVKRFFLPMVVMAALLPLSLIAVVYGFSDTLFPRAAEPNTVRVWLSPTAVVTKAGQPVSFTVMAAFDKTTAIIPSISVGFTSTNADVSPATISYDRPLQGKASIGTVQFTALTLGEKMIVIPPESVVIGGDNHPDVSVGGATITVVQ